MSLNKYRDLAGEFLKKAGFDQENINIRFELLTEELELLQEAVDDKTRFRHQVYDVLFILFEIAADYEMDLDAEWVQGMKRKAQKYWGGK